jgi:CDP-diacylglycerol--glycerol-3-phosphate 3-phosphatidyltransferase
MNLPNLITFIRIALTPLFVAVYVMPGKPTYLIAAALFGIAGLTDWLDGYVARRLGQTTKFGAFIDPVADKLIVVTALVLLVGHPANLWLTLPATVIVGREIVVSALREWMAEMNRRGAVAVSWLGKAKTTFQVIALLVLLAHPPDLEAPLVQLGYALLYAAALLTLWSMVLYLKAAWPSLRDGMADE